ncbi:CinA family protein [Ramlibacter tataouinensis]|uniref:CinA family protein n=1 Tax=Ramlibacter tataouinensis TaxID=94132 RepID=UPI0022F3DB2E|nr:CinA family protein [Ramlibacter tataouinensis]WBY03855.1 CinA family protein [Ramlibacter tataouinensis]
MDARLNALCEELAQVLRGRGWMLASAESCTGGLIAAACTALPGSSNWFERGFVTYSNAAKTELLGVDEQAIASHGAVSEVVARAMAFGALRRSRAQAAVAVTGIAGPDGGSADKPVGTVWFGFSVDGHLSSETVRFDGDRQAIREATVQHALARLLALLQGA